MHHRPAPKIRRSTERSQFCQQDGRAVPRHIAPDRVLDRAELADLLAAQDKGFVAVLDLRVDQVNEQFGRASGDRTLAAFAAMLSRALRAGDITARSGGQQFLLLLAETELDSICPLIARLRALWERRAPHPCAFYCSAAPLETTGREAYARATADLRRVVALGESRDTASVASSALSEGLQVRDLQIALAGSRAIRRAPTAEAVEQELRTAAIALGGVYPGEDDDREGAQVFALARSGRRSVGVGAVPGTHAWLALEALLPDLLADAELTNRALREARARGDRGLGRSPDAALEMRAG
jgi:GGDEF domain-containing protein